MPWKFVYNDLFRAALYRLMIVLHKDALFHLQNLCCFKMKKNHFNHLNFFISQIFFFDVWVIFIKPVSLTTKNAFKVEFTLAKFVGKIISNIANIFACLTYLSHTLQIGMILFVLCHPRKPRQSGLSISRHDMANIFANNFANVN